MKHEEKIVAKKVDLGKLLDEVEKNTRKIKVHIAMDTLYGAIINNEKNNPFFKEIKETLGEEKYVFFVNQIVFTMAMMLTSQTLPKKELEKVIARCDVGDEEEVVKA